MSRSRRLIGRHSGLAERRRLYVTDDAFEVDTLEAYYVVRRRLLFDDVLLVTLHGERAARDWIMLVLGTGLALVFVAIAASAPTPVGWTVALAGSAGVLVPAILPIARGRLIVSIFGRRTMGRASWPYRHAAAFEAYRLVVDRVRAAQARMQRASPAAPSPSAAPVPDAAPSAGASAAPPPNDTD